MNVIKIRIYLFDRCRLDCSAGKIMIALIFVNLLLWADLSAKSFENKSFEMKLAVESEESLKCAVLQGLQAFRTNQIQIIRLHPMPNQADPFLETIFFNRKYDFSFVISEINCERRNEGIVLKNIVLIVDSYENFSETFKKIMNENNSMDADFLIVVKKFHLKGVSKIFEVFWKLNIFNVNLIHQNQNGIIEMWSFYPLSAESCNNFEPFAINWFDKHSNEWSRKVLFPQKFKNFFQCAVRAVIHDLYGFDKNIFYELALQLNFSITVVKPVKPAEIGNIYPNGTATDTMKLLKDGSVDLVIRILAMDESRAKYLSYINNFFDDYFIIVVPPTTELSSFSKLFHPFRLYSWVALATFVAFILSIIKCSSTSTYNFVIGKNIRNPYLNIVTAFTGTTQQAVPKGFFARCLLSMFLIFCLIIRTMYSGKLFAAMRSNILPAPLPTIDDYYNNGFEFYVRNGFAKKFQGLKYFKK